MNTTEKLQAIRAYCVNALDIASKRTPGEWTHEVKSTDPNRTLVNLRHKNGVIATFATRAGHLNLEFAASCAGPAEAGWKATIAAIDLVEQTCRREHGSDYTPLAEAALKDIIAAWEGIV